jgi:hypothetical protein
MANEVRSNDVTSVPKVDMKFVCFAKMRSG